MKKREQGVLTVEAAIVLTLCTMFVLFLFSFARVYSAQSVVSHAVLQSSDALGLESYLRETALHGSEEEIAELANRLTGSTTATADSFVSLRSGDVPKIIKEKFAYAIAGTEVLADKKLKSLGVKDGLSGVDFSSSKIDLGNDDVIVFANYTIEMQFPVFGFKELNVTKAAKSKTFGDILFGIQTIANDPNMGKAGGGGSYKHGTQVKISASPNYGYKFLKWEDGSTANPRTVTVTGSKTYVAIFVEDQFGINTVVNGSGSVSGGGSYKYKQVKTITATPSTGYHFKKWTIFGHKNNNTIEVNTAKHNITVDQTYTCTAYFEPSSFGVSVKCQGGPNNSLAQIVVGSSASQSITAKYQSNFKITANSINGYRFVGWKIEGTSNYFSTSASVDLTVPEKNVTYVACYVSTIKTVTFYNGNGTVFATRKVSEGQALGGNMPGGQPYYTGYRFNGWKGFNSGTIVWNDTKVYGNWSWCGTHKYGNCGVKHYFGGQVWFAKTNIHLQEGHYATWASCTRCIYCKKQGTYRVLCGRHYEKWGANGWKNYPYVGPNDCGTFNLS